MSHKPRASASPLRPSLFAILLHFACVLPVALSGVSCGKVGAPVAPARITERTSDLSAIQRGNTVFLSWPAPPLVQQESSRSYIARADIYRLIERRSEEPVLDPDDYEEMAEVIGYLDRTTIEAQLKSVGQLQYADALNLNPPTALANTRLRYAIRYVNKRGQAAAFSNTVAVEPVAGISLPPTGLRVAGEAQDAVTISWSPSDANVDGSRPALVVGYNVYRRPAKRPAPREPLNEEPVAGTSFTDKKFQYQANYIYTVRALSQGLNGLIESADSEPLSVTPVDTFPPSPPDPVSVASANGVISLFWPSSAEWDVIGYNIYRAESADAPEANWVKLNAQPLAPVTYRDDRVVIGQRYFYKITAIDRFNNESKPSGVVSETANP